MVQSCVYVVHACESERGLAHDLQNKNHENIYLMYRGCVGTRRPVDPVDCTYIVHKHI